MQGFQVGSAPPESRAGSAVPSAFVGVSLAVSSLFLFRGASRPAVEECLDGRDVRMYAQGDDIHARGVWAGLIAGDAVGTQRDM